MKINYKQIMNLQINDPRINWKYLAIVVVLGLAVGGGVWWYANSLRVEPQTPQIVIPRPTPSPTPVSGTDTSTWQTYRNSEFGFEVRYPPDWFKASGVSQITAFSNKKDNFASSDADLIVMAITAHDEQIMRDFFEKLRQLSRGEKAALIPKTEMFYTKVEDLTITGLPAVKAKELFGAARNEIVLLKKEGVVFTFDLKPSKATKAVKDNKRIFNQILSTFRFVE